MAETEKKEKYPDGFYLNVFMPKEKPKMANYKCPKCGLHTTYFDDPGPSCKMTCWECGDKLVKY